MSYFHCIMYGLINLHVAMRSMSNKKMGTLHKILWLSVLIAIKNLCANHQLRWLGTYEC